VTRKPPSHLLGALLRVALEEDEEAISSWRTVEAAIDLEIASGDEYDALCLVGSRLGRLEATGTDRARIAGLARHAWATNQAAFEAAGLGACRPLVGRWATIAHLPHGWVLPAGVDRPAARWTGPTATRPLAGRDVLVPTLASQLVWALAARQWVDAACLLALEPDRADVAAEAARHRRSVAVRNGLATLSDVVGASVVTADRTPQITVGPVRAAREQAWTAAFAAASRVRATVRAAGSE
jgi:hypothetical protein